MRLTYWMPLITFSDDLTPKLLGQDIGVCPLFWLNSSSKELFIKEVRKDGEKGLVQVLTTVDWRYGAGVMNLADVRKLVVFLVSLFQYVLQASFIGNS